MASQVAIKRGKEDKGCLSQIMWDVVEKLLKMQSRMTKGPLCSFIRVYMHVSGRVYPMGYKKEHRLACYLLRKSQIGLTKTSTYGGLMKCSLSKYLRNDLSFF